MVAIAGDVVTFAVDGVSLTAVRLTVLVRGALVYVPSVATNAMLREGVAPPGVPGEMPVGLSLEALLNATLRRAVW